MNNDYIDKEQPQKKQTKKVFGYFQVIPILLHFTLKF